MPTISIVAAYSSNTQASLARTIDSVMAQTFSDWELLLCEDDSNSPSLASLPAIADKRIRRLPGIPGGNAAFARNRGIRAANGEWIAFLDSTDLWRPAKLAEQLSFALRLPYLAVAEQRAENGRLSGNGKNNEKCSFVDFMDQNPLRNGSVLVHQSLLRRTGGFPEEDLPAGADYYALWLRAACFSDVGLQPELLYPGEAEEKASLAADGGRGAALRDFLYWTASQVIREDYLCLARQVYRQCCEPVRTEKTNA